ncbi:hypothetical protein C0995_008842, partial [Termitomyces sp. Mi166
NCVDANELSIHAVPSNAISTSIDGSVSRNSIAVQAKSFLNTMDANTKVLLVTGATGKQGKALISAIQVDTTKPSPFHILALTRNAKSPAAKQLSLRENIEVVEGDLDNVGSIREIFEDAKKKGGVWGVFCVLAFPGLGANADGEEKQGKASLSLFLEEYAY